MTPEMKTLLLNTRRTLRTNATMMQNSRIGFLVLRDGAKDPNKKAVLKAYLSMLPEMVALLRSVANEADKYLRAGTITDDDFDSFRQRSQRAFIQSKAMCDETLSVLETQTV